MPNSRSRSVYERLVPPGLQKRFKALQSDEAPADQFTSVCILHLKLLPPPLRFPTAGGATDLFTAVTTAHALNQAETGNTNAFVEQLDSADRKLVEICRKYKAFKVDFCGAYLILCGIGAKTGREDKHVITAAKMATEILGWDLTKEKALQWQCALHKGTVHTVLVNNGVPKCHVVGEPIEKTQTLLGYSQPGRILMSQDFYLNLKLIAIHRFQTIFNAKLKIQVSVGGRGLVGRAMPASL